MLGHCKSGNWKNCLVLELSVDSAPLTQVKLDALWSEIQNALAESSWAEAEGLIRRFVQLVPAAPVEVWDVLAYALLMQADYSACLAVLKPWSNHATRNFWVNHKIGDALRGLNQLNEAVGAYQLSLADGSNTPLTVRNLLQVLDALAPQRAVSQLDEWHSQGPLPSFVLEGAREAAVLVPSLDLAEALFLSGAANAPCRRRLLEAACYSFDLRTCARLLDASRLSADGLSTWELKLQAMLGIISD